MQKSAWCLSSPHRPPRRSPHRGQHRSRTASLAALATAVVGSAVGAARFGCCRRSLARCRAAAPQPCCAGASRCSRQPLRATAFSRCRCGLRAFTASALQAGLGHSQHPSALLAGLGHSQHPWRPTRRARLRLLLGARANHRGPRPFAVPLWPSGTHGVPTRRARLGCCSALAPTTAGLGLSRCRCVALGSSRRRSGLRWRRPWTLRFTLDAWDRLVWSGQFGCVCARLARTYSEAGRVRPRLAVVSLPISPTPLLWCKRNVRNF